MIGTSLDLPISHKWSSIDGPLEKYFALHYIKSITSAIPYVYPISFNSLTGRSQHSSDPSSDLMYY